MSSRWPVKNTKYICNSTGDMSGESMLAMQELGCFLLPGIVYRSFQHGVVHYHAATWGDGLGWMAQQWASWSCHVSLWIQNAINKMHHTIISPPPWATRSTTLTSAHRSPTQRRLPSALYSENRDSSVKRTPLQSARRHRMWAFAHSSQLRWQTAVRSRPRWGRWECRWASLRRFLTVCAEILWLCKPIVAAAVRVAGLRWAWRWRYWMWRSWAGVVTRGLRLWSRLDVLPNSLKCLWRRLMVEKLTFNSRATALVDILAVSMPIARSLKLATFVVLCCVIKLHILEWPFIVQPKAHLCNNHAV